MQYNLEIYDASMEFFAHTSCEAPLVIVDYITEDTTEFTIPEIIDGLKPCMYVRARKGKEAVYEGIISGTETGQDTTTMTVSCIPLYALLDTDVRDTTGDYGIMSWLSRMYSTVRVSGMPDLVFDKTLNPDISGEVTIHHSDEWIVNIRDVLISVLRNDGYRVDFSMDVKNRTVNVVCRSNADSGVCKINTSISDVVSCEYDDASDDLPVNVAICIDSTNSTETNTISRKYYWIPSEDGMTGSVSTSAAGIKPPVRYTMLAVTVNEGSTFETAALAAAREALTKTQCDNSMTIIYNASSKIIRKPEIGRMYLIRDRGTDRYSICTGYQMINESQMQITLGYARRSMSQIIRKLARR